MSNYPSNITFLYYNDLNHGSYIMETVLELSLVMDQGFARIYQINETGYLGIVAKTTPVVSGDTLISLNTSTVESEHKRVGALDVINVTDIKVFPTIPLHSFFFEDKEGHRFEIQQFLKDDHIRQFLA